MSSHFSHGTRHQHPTKIRFDPFQNSSFCQTIHNSLMSSLPVILVSDSKIRKITSEARTVPFAIFVGLINGFMMKDYTTEIFANFLVSMKHHISKSFSVFFIRFYTDLNIQINYQKAIWFGHYDMSHIWAIWHWPYDMALSEGLHNL